MHGGTATLAQSVPFRETFEGRTAWRASCTSLTWPGIRQRSALTLGPPRSRGVTSAGSWRCCIRRGSTRPLSGASGDLAEKRAKRENSDMRIWLLLLVLWSSSTAHAQAPQVSGIDVTDYGIYTSEKIGKEPSPGTITGTMDIVRDARLEVKTRVIPAQLGISFGFEYKIIGAPAGSEVPLRFVAIFPSEMTNPNTRVSSNTIEQELIRIIGRTYSTGYMFTEPWELIHGPWILQLWHDGQKLTEQAFTVQAPN